VNPSHICEEILFIKKLRMETKQILCRSDWNITFHSFKIHLANHLLTIDVVEKEW